jgi:hypothetical protein
VLLVDVLTGLFPIFDSESIESVDGSLVRSGASVCIVSIVPASETSSMDGERRTELGIGGEDWPLGF